MRFLLNGKECHLEKESLTITDMIGQYDLRAERGVAIAVNEEVVPKKDWPTHAVKDKDKVLLITATQGG